MNETSQPRPANLSSADVSREVYATHSCHDVVSGDEAEPSAIERFGAVIAEHEELPRRHDERSPVVAGRGVMRGIETRLACQVGALPPKLVRHGIRRIRVLSVSLTQRPLVDEDQSALHGQRIAWQSDEALDELLGGIGREFVNDEVAAVRRRRFPDNVYSA